MERDDPSPRPATARVRDEVSAIYSRWTAEESNWFLGALVLVFWALLIGSIVWIRPIVARATGASWLVALLLTLLLAFLLFIPVLLAFVLPKGRKARDSLRRLLASGATVPETVAALLSYRSPQAGALIADVGSLCRADPQAQIDCEYALALLHDPLMRPGDPARVSPEVVAAAQPPGARATPPPAAGTAGGSPLATAEASVSLGGAALAALDRLDEIARKAGAAEAPAIERQLQRFEAIVATETMPAQDAQEARRRIAAIRSRLVAAGAARGGASTVVASLQEAMAAVPDEYHRRPFVMALNYIQAVEFLDGCGEFSLAKLRRAYEIAGVDTPETDEETERIWERSSQILSSLAAGRGPGEPGGHEFLRFELRRTYLEGIRNAAPHCGPAAGAVLRWLSTAAAPAPGGAAGSHGPR